MMIPEDSYDGENWKPVVDHEDRYLISDLGRVWSVKRRLKHAPQLPGYDPHRHYYKRRIGGKQVHIYTAKGKKNGGRKYFQIKKPTTNGTVRLWIDEEMPKAFGVV